jgi:hypothetical protein
MRTIHVAIAALAVAAAGALAPQPAQAIEYPWCVQYGGSSGSQNCGFSTFAQCQASASGTGGFCVENPFYVPAPERPARRGKRGS